jgi:hydrogenase maturation protein HypF
VVKKLRERRKKSDQPFAIMAKDIEMVKSFAEVNEIEEKLLKSWQRPIVILKKSKNYWLSQYISPGLHTIGVMLPYTALHYLLFDYLDEPIVMTSGNLPEETTITDEREAFKKLKNVVDYFLIHNRGIWQRCDDSVIKVINRNPIFLRRSRGYVPIPIEIDLNRNVLALGAELNNTFCILTDKKAFLSQHVGDAYNYDELLALKCDIKKWMQLLNLRKFDIIVCDLHPQFNTTKLAEELSNRFNARIVRVQHHFSHLAACMGEYNLERAIGIVCDGYGFGLDKKAWGGEILLMEKNRMKRVGHLEYQPLLGLDRATLNPLRIVVGILAKFLNENEIKKLLKEKVEEEIIDVWIEQLNQKFNVIETSSCGRFLDAVSALLGVCEKRSYEGEPAMKLESVAINGEKIIEFPIKIERKGDEYILNTTKIFQALIEHLEETKENLALSVHYALAKGLAKIVEKIGKKENVCFGGGVAYNSLFNKFLLQEIPNLKVSRQIPCGDGGISFGQIYFLKLNQQILG